MMTIEQVRALANLSDGLAVVRCDMHHAYVRVGRVVAGGMVEVLDRDTMRPLPHYTHPAHLTRV